MMKPFLRIQPILATVALATFTSLAHSQTQTQRLTERGQSLWQGICQWVSGQVSGAPAEAAPAAEAWTEILSKLEAAKNEAQNQLRRSERALASGQSFRVEHEAVCTSYGERRVIVNALIERMKARLIVDQSDATALLEDLRQALAAATASESALAVRDGKNPIAVSLVGTAVAAVVESLVENAVEAWGSMRIERRRLLLEELEAKKWPPAASTAN